jgi:hypothetical protein
MARNFNYYDDWRATTLECPRCGWKGTFDEGSVELHDELMDSSCPRCPWAEAPMLAIVSYPTIEEGERNLSRLSAAEKNELAARKQAREHWYKVRLKSPGQLPELDGPHFELEWDFVEDETGKVTVLRYGETVVWREPAIWEGYDRFAEVVLILEQRYGPRLTDVVPTSASELYLYGDKLSASDRVRAVRESLVHRRRSP